MVGEHVMLMVQRYDPGKAQMYGKIMRQVVIFRKRLGS